MLITQADLMVPRVEAYAVYDAVDLLRMLEEVEAALEVYASSGTDMHEALHKMRLDPSAEIAEAIEELTSVSSVS